MGEFRYFVWFLIILVVCFLISSARKKPINAGKWAFIILAVLALAESTFACYLVSQQPGISPEQQGRFVGRQGGAAVFPLIVSGIMWWRFEKRKEEFQSESREDNNEGPGE